MKRLIIMALVVGMAAAVFGALALDWSEASAAKEKPVFVGTWEAIDVDGSYMQMSINPGLTFKYVDDWASACPEGGPATFMGKGELVDPRTFEGEGVVRCSVSHERWEGPVSLVAVGPDQLTDGWGNIWVRVP